MVYKGIVQKGSVKLPPSADLPDGTEVLIEPIEDKPLRKLLDGLADLESDPACPDDLAAQHDHYLYGTPKKEI